MANMRRVQYQGSITYVPVTKTQPAASYWGFNISSCTYGTYTNVFTTSTAGIVDTGTARMFLSRLLHGVSLDLT